MARFTEEDLRRLQADETVRRELEEESRRILEKKAEKGDVIYEDGPPERSRRFLFFRGKEKNVIIKKVLVKTPQLSQWLRVLMLGGMMMAVMGAYTYTASISAPADATPDVLQKVENQKATGLLLMFLFGCLGFGIPMMLVGWMIADPVMRAKTMRQVLKKNYGIVNLVSRGGKILTKIKDFNGDLLWLKDAVWVLEPGRIYKRILSENPAAVEEFHPIEEKDIYNEIGIPILFLSLDTMRPLRFMGDEGEANPIDLGSTLKGWVFNQLAKEMFFKRTFSILLVAGIGASVAAAYYAYSAYNDLEDMKVVLTEIKEQLRILIETQGATVIEQGG